MSQQTSDQTLTKVSIVVPTMGRSAFVLRLLRYLCAEGFCGDVLIGDSSDPESVQHLQEAIARVRKGLRVTYEWLPHMNEPRVSGRLLDLVSTPYVVWVADDDLVVPSGIVRGVEWLEEHPECNLAHGVSAMMLLTQDGPYGPLEAVWPHYWQEFEGHTASQRLQAYLGSRYFAPLFSVHRIAPFRAIYRRASPALLDDKILMENFVGCLCAIDGSAKRLPGLYLIRQHHRQRYLVSHFFEWITAPGWSAAYQDFRRGVVEALAQRDGLSLEEAQRIVKEAFWPWLAARLTSHWQRYQGRSNRPWQDLREVARRVRAFKTAWRMLRSLLPNPSGALSLPAMRRASSPYHEAFVPLYRLITEGGIESAALLRGGMPPADDRDAPAVTREVMHAV